MESKKGESVIFYVVNIYSIVREKSKKILLMLQNKEKLAKERKNAGKFKSKSGSIDKNKKLNPSQYPSYDKSDISSYILNIN